MKHTCHRCSRSFARLEHLSRHERSHTKEKPFACCECSQAFTRKDLLTRHIRIHHVSSDRLRGANSNRSAASAVEQPPEVGQQNHNPLTTSTFAVSSNSSQFHPTSDQQLLMQPDPYMPIAVDSSGQGSYDFWAPQFAGDFSTFLDTIDHPTDPFSAVYQPLPFYASPDSHPEPTLSSDPTLDSTAYTSAVSPERSPQILAANGVSWPAAVQPLGVGAAGIQGGDHDFSTRFEVDDSCRRAVEAKVDSFRHIFSESSVFPSKHTLNRFVRGWLSTFNNHWPIVHLPSASLPEIQVELFLAIATIGAQYCWERPKSQLLFEMSKSIALERIRLASAKVSAAPGLSHDLIQTAQALVLLIAVSMWSQSEPSLHQALFLRSSLLTLVQNGTLDYDPPRGSAPVRSTWVRYETAKRTKLVAFCFFNLLTIIYDLPPVLGYNKLQSKLPCSEEHWRSDGTNVCPDGIQQADKELTFEDAVEVLLRPDKDISTLRSSITSLGNYILIHAVIQHIWILQQSDKMSASNQITYQLSEVEKILKKWQQLWKADQQSSSNPNNTSGPLSFTSLALLRLAYIRATTKAGFCGALNIWDPEMIGKSLYQEYSLARSDAMTRVALHSAQALAIPIKMGINFVAQTQVFYWSNQVALASLECILLLSKWLEAVTVGNGRHSLSPKEENVLDFVVQLIGETEFDAPKKDLIKGRRLSILVVRLWSRLFRRDHVWELISVIGRALEAYADNLEQQENGV